MPPAKKRSGRNEGGKCITKYTNADLPQGAQLNNTWRKKFITTYEKWLGTCTEPWDVEDTDSCMALQAIWNTVYPHIDYVVDADGPVFYIVSSFFFALYLFFPYSLISYTNRPISVLRNGGVPLVRMLFHCSRLLLRVKNSLPKKRSPLLASCSRTVHSCMQIRAVKHNR